MWVWLQVYWRGVTALLVLISMYVGPSKEGCRDSRVQPITTAPVLCMSPLQIATQNRLLKKSDPFGADFPQFYRPRIDSRLEKVTDPSGRDDLRLWVHTPNIVCLVSFLS